MNRSHGEAGHAAAERRRPTAGNRRALAWTGVAGLLGPVVAWLVTWQPAVAVTRVGGLVDPAPQVIEKLRSLPSDTVLAELWTVAVGVPDFDHLNDREAVEAADAVLRGRFTLAGDVQLVSVPFVAADEVFGSSGWHLRLCSFAVPAMLARGYRASGESRFLEAAVRYVRDWSSFESALLIPRGYVFNDHATAARAVVVTEIWRLYRSSPAYRAEEAQQLLLYVQRLSRLLRQPRLYEYRTNHGLMQNLSLLHLATAFPVLAEAPVNAAVGRERLLSQLDYFISEDGVVLEHSPGYQHFGLRCLAAAARYLGLQGQAMLPTFVDRYRRGLSYAAALRRPDGSFPPIGDTDDRVLPQLPVALFDDGSVVSSPLIEEVPRAPPSAVTMSAAGNSIVWRGLGAWPDPERLSQTVFFWGDFPTQAHKHADELGISLWARGIQWVRSVGYWPYDASRNAAIGWRSSNAPHWLDERSDVERSSVPIAAVANDDVSFLEVVRTDVSGSHVRRQLVQAGNRVWAVLDSFESQHARGAEIIWRFSPEVALRPMGDGRYRLTASDRPLWMTLQVTGSGLSLTPDPDGTAAWNSGVLASGRVTKSAAIQIVADTPRSGVLSLFTLHEPPEFFSPDEAVDLQWNGSAAWQISVIGGGRQQLRFQRSGDRLSTDGAAGPEQIWTLSTALSRSTTDSMKRSVQSYKSAAQKHGRPFKALLERRVKVSVTIAALALVQLPLLIAVRRYRARLWPPLLIASSLCWVALAAFLGWYFLA